jgi:hypothetical protein
MVRVIKQRLFEREVLKDGFWEEQGWANEVWSKIARGIIKMENRH